jgi:uncharacterized membrane protein
VKSIQARVAAIVASYIAALLVAHGFGAMTPDGAARIESWLSHTFELVLFLGYAVVHPWLQKRWNPTGAYTQQAAERLEQVAHITDGGGRPR